LDKNIPGALRAFMAKRAGKRSVVRCDDFACL
jgi:hypothetical protein